MKILIWPLLLALSFSINGKTLKSTQGKFSLTYPNSWSHLENAMAVPHSLLGTYRNGNRPWVGIYPQTQDSVKGYSTELEKRDYEIYYRKKKKSLTKIGALLQRFEKPTRVEKNGIVKRTYGVVFKKDKNTFFESTVFIDCTFRRYIVKTLIRDDKIREHKKEVKGILNSFKCL